MRPLAQVIAQPTKTKPLDAIDREIINILAYNSRTPLSQIAKWLDTSTEVIHYRYQRLRDENIITDTFVVFDPKLLGIHRYSIYLQFHSLSAEKMQKIIQSFLENPSVCWIIETSGKWELVLMVETLSEDEFNRVKENILSPIDEFVNDHMVSIVTNFIHQSPRYIGGMKKKEEYTSVVHFPYEEEFHSTENTPVNVDAKDIQVIKLLHEDARIPLTELGEKVNLSRDAVDYRIKKMIKMKVIKSFILRLNYHALNFQYTTIMLKLHGVSSQRKKEFFDYLMADERFYALMEQIGSWDLSVMMFFAHPKDQREFLIDIKEKFSDVIHTHESSLQFNQYYFTYLAESVYQQLITKSL